MTFDAPARFLIRLQHRLFYLVMSFARFNLYRLSYEHLWNTRNEPKKARGGRWWWWLEIMGLCVWWAWYGRVLVGTGSWGKAVGYLLISNIVPSPLHVQVRILLPSSRSFAHS